MISSNNERELKRSTEHSKYKPGCEDSVQINGTKKHSESQDFNLSEVPSQYIVVLN